MSNTLKQIVKNIQFVKNWSIEQVAESIGYSRVHLNKAMNSKDGNMELEKMILQKHSSILQSVSGKGGGSLSLSEASITLQVRAEARQGVILAALAEILANQNDSTVLKVKGELESTAAAEESKLRMKYGLPPVS